MRKIPSYETYVKAYEKKKTQLAKKGYSMYDEMLSASEYQISYTALRNDQLEQVAAGKRKGASNILRDLVNDQAYKLTRQQALNMRKAARRAGMEYTLADLQTGTINFSSILDEKRWNLIAKGYSKGEAALLISQEYFGSP